MTDGYHHGDLRAALLEAAVATIEDAGPAAMSLREVARRAGVTHPAATYHFGDKAGLLTAVAAEGYRLLGDALSQARRRTADFLEVGVAYVRFAVTHRAYFEVMYRPELYNRADPAVKEAKAATAALLYRSPDPDLGQLSEGVAAWAIVHGIATLWLNGNLPPQLGDDPEQITRIVASHLGIQPPSLCKSAALVGVTSTRLFAGWCHTNQHRVGLRRRPAMAHAGHIGQGPVASGIRHPGAARSPANISPPVHNDGG